MKKNLLKILEWFKHKEPVIEKVLEDPEPEVHTRERDIKDLLRENLSLVSLDIFYIDDPLLAVPPERRLEYLKKFWDLCADKDIMEWFKYLINKQARLTLQQKMNNPKDNDDLGAMNVNGIATVKDQFEKLANTYVKENVPPTEFNKNSIF